MKAILSRTHPERYWDVFHNLFWYKNSIVNEGAHPMLTGVRSLEGPHEPAGVFPAAESRLAHLRRRIPEICKFLRGTRLRVALEMEEVWLATRKRSEAEVRAIEELGDHARRTSPPPAGSRISGRLTSAQRSGCLRSRFPRGSACSLSRLRP